MTQKNKKCKHKWTVENVPAPHVQALVVCLKCLTVKKPLGVEGPTLHFVSEGSVSEKNRSARDGLWEWQDGVVRNAP